MADQLVKAQRKAARATSAFTTVIDALEDANASLDAVKTEASAEIARQEERYSEAAQEHERNARVVGQLRKIFQGGHSNP